MRKVINGKAYDTDKAQLVCWSDNGLERKDFGYLSESLYRKRTGEYFLHCEGGASTRYAERDALGGWMMGEAVEPLSWEAARSWAEGNLDAAAYEAEFGEADEGDSDEVVLSVRVPAWVKSAIDRESARTGETRGQVVARAVSGVKSGD